LHHRTVEQLAAQDSPIHRLDPRAKLLAALLFVIAVAVIPARPLAVFVAPFVFVAIGLVFSGLPFLFVLSRTLMVLPFVVMVAVFLPFTQGSDAVWKWEALGLTVYREGLESALAILIRGALAILAVGWLVFTTPFHRLLLALQSLRIPRAVVATLGFLFRYLDQLADEAARVRRARSARTPGHTGRWRGRSTGGLVGRLFLRTLDRADRIHRAMVARGFDGEVRDLSRLSMRRTDAWFLAGAVAGVVVLFVVGVQLGWMDAR
jgi:cobalt/nickel transport system permease protein